eukprot:7383659-Prymnesium_polylepis.2
MIDRFSKALASSWLREVGSPIDLSFLAITARRVSAAMLFPGDVTRGAHKGRPARVPKRGFRGSREDGRGGVPIRTCDHRAGGERVALQFSLRCRGRALHCHRENGVTDGGARGGGVKPVPRERRSMADGRWWRPGA